MCNAARLIRGVRSFWRELVIPLGGCYPPAPHLIRGVRSFWRDVVIPPGGCYPPGPPHF